MIIECLDQVRVSYDEKEFLFEDGFGYVYQIDAALGAKAVATKKCREIVVDEEHPYKGPVPESPWRSL